MKLTFPYERWDAIEAVASKKDWPAYGDFASSLSRKKPTCYKKSIMNALRVAKELWEDITFVQFIEALSLKQYVSGDENNFSIADNIANWYVVDPEVYLRSKHTYEVRQMENMLEYLKFYNCVDVEVLTAAFSRYSKSFFENFALNPLDFVSLPGMAEKAMWRHYDTTVNSPYTFHDNFSHVPKLIKSQIVGGLACCFHRHAQTAISSEPDPLTTKTPSGKDIKILKSFDVNSKLTSFFICYLFYLDLYGFCMMQSLPGGVGSIYTKQEERGFKWESMMPKSTFSWQSIEWLNFQNNQAPFMVDNERKYVIRHHLNGGEVTLECDGQSYSVDGYCEVEDVKYIFEFDGCSWHHCPTCNNDKKLKDKDNARDDALSKLGVLVKTTSCQWERLKKVVTYRNFTSVFFNAQKLITEEQLLRKIDSGELFGLVECSVKSPDSVIKRFSEIGHPPVYRHVQVTADMIGETMLEQMLSQNRNVTSIGSQLSLTFHAEHILLTTEFVKFYREIGIEIFNITKVIEFERAEPLKKFINKVTEQRIQATFTGDESARYLSPLFRFVTVVSVPYGNL